MNKPADSVGVKHLLSPGLSFLKCKTACPWTKTLPGSSWNLVTAVLSFESFFKIFMLAHTSPGPLTWTHCKPLAFLPVSVPWPHSPSCAAGAEVSKHKDWWQKEKGTTEDEMVGWRHWLDGHEFEQAPGVGDGQGSLACWSPWSCKESELNRDRLECDVAHRAPHGPALRTLPASSKAPPAPLHRPSLCPSFTGPPCTGPLNTTCCSLKLPCCSLSL